MHGKSSHDQTYDDPEQARAAFGSDNPLVNSASYKITLKDVSKQADFVQFLNNIEGVRKVTSSEYTADSISAINAFVGYASLGIIDSFPGIYLPDQQYNHHRYYRSS